MSRTVRCGVAVLVGLLGLALTGCSAETAATPQDQPIMVTVANVSQAETGPGNTFSISAPNVAGLYPGATRRLKLTVTNPYGFAIKVTDLWGRLETTSKNKCVPSSSNLMVQGVDGVTLPLTVGPRSGRAAGAVPLYMPNTVVDACQRASFTISLHGKARKASGS